MLRDETREVRRQAGDRPVYYTEWCTSSNPRDPMHDEPYAAAFIIKTIMEANGLVQGYSYWTFSDIFEENYFPSVLQLLHVGLVEVQLGDRGRDLGVREHAHLRAAGDESLDLFEFLKVYD